MSGPLAIDAIEVAYARFNALKTLTTSVPSEFEVTRFGPIFATRDRAREDAYYNRVLGLAAGSLREFDQAIAWITGGAQDDHQLRADVPEGHGERAELEQRGFSHGDTLVWLSMPSRSMSPRSSQQPIEQCRELTRDDWPALQTLRDVDWPADPHVWAQKRSHFCTNTFRWFGIFDGPVLVSAASLWVHGDIAVLGSAFTLPAHRNRGHQRLLLDSRCSAWPGQLVVDVEPHSTSYRNCLRAGFEEFEKREVWTRQV